MSGVIVPKMSPARSSTRIRHSSYTSRGGSSSNQTKSSDAPWNFSRPWSQLLKPMTEMPPNTLRTRIWSMIPEGEPFLPESIVTSSIHAGAR